MTPTKPCARCGIVFTPAPEARGRNRARCKPCNAIAAEVYRKQNAATVRVTEARRAKDPNRIAKVRIWSRATRLKLLYGISVEEYERRFAAQNGLCAICMKPETDAAALPRADGSRVTRRLSVDHNHKTKKVRELLCRRCNAALGHLGEDIEIAKRLILYLEKHADLTTVSQVDRNTSHKEESYGVQVGCKVA